MQGKFALCVLDLPNAFWVAKYFSRTSGQSDHLRVRAAPKFLKREFVCRFTLNRAFRQGSSEALNAWRRKRSVVKKRRSNMVLQARVGPNTFWLDTPWSRP
jgi:hypothetical protein